MTERRLARALVMAGAVGGLLLGLVPLAVRAGDREGARPAMTRGLAALDRGDARTARIELMNALKADPDWADARIAQARALLELGDGVGAQADIERARALGSPPGRTRHLMAHAYLLQGNEDGAVREAEAADVLPAQQAYALRIAARARQAMGDSGTAGRDLSAALTLAPRDGATWVDIARYRLASGDRGGALVAADNAVRLAPRSADAMLLRANMVRDQYGLRAALPWYDRVLAIDPNHVPALLDQAATCLDLGQAGRMLSLTRRALALSPGNPRAFYLQALMAARAGRDGLAMSLMSRTGNALAAMPGAMLLRGVVLLRQGSPDLAVAPLGALVQAQPDNLEARTLLARAQLGAGRPREAWGALAPVIARPDADSYALTLAARIEEALGQPESASALLARAAIPAIASPSALPGMPAQPADGTAAPQNIAYIRDLLKRGDTGAAITRARILVSANPGAPAAAIVLGDALLAGGRAREAALVYERAANLRFSEETALRLVSAWRLAGEPDKAARVLTLFLGQAPQSIDAMRIAATAWLDDRQWDKAITLLEDVRGRIGPNDTLLMSDLAWAWLGKGDVRRALVYAAHAYRLQPSSPVAADAYGYMLLRAGQDGRGATDLMEKAVALAPAHPSLRLHLGEAYAAAGRKQDARRALEMAANDAGFAGRDQARRKLAELAGG
ncbi:MAG: hypothetical protein DI547_12230 [Sphingobium sp.]|nr:MAG: hypothetical protein DI547_12230 [Sphingobium sp.]